MLGLDGFVDLDWILFVCDSPFDQDLFYIFIEPGHAGSNGVLSPRRSLRLRTSRLTDCRR